MDAVITQLLERFRRAQLQREIADNVCSCALSGDAVSLTEAEAADAEGEVSDRVDECLAWGIASKMIVSAASKKVVMADWLGGGTGAQQQYDVVKLLLDQHVGHGGGSIEKRDRLLREVRSSHERGHKLDEDDDEVISGFVDKLNQTQLIQDFTDRDARDLLRASQKLRLWLPALIRISCALLHQDPSDKKSAPCGRENCRLEERREPSLDRPTVPGSGRYSSSKPPGRKRKRGADAQPPRTPDMKPRNGVCPAAPGPKRNKSRARPAGLSNSAAVKGASALLNEAIDGRCCQNNSEMFFESLCCDE